MKTDKIRRMASKVLEFDYHSLRGDSLDLFLKARTIAESICSIIDGAIDGPQPDDRMRICLLKSASSKLTTLLKRWEQYQALRAQQPVAAQQVEEFDPSLYGATRSPSNIPATLAEVLGRRVRKKPARHSDDEVDAEVDGDLLAELRQPEPFAIRQAAPEESRPAGRHTLSSGGHWIEMLDEIDDQ